MAQLSDIAYGQEAKSAASMEQGLETANASLLGNIEAAAPAQTTFNRAIGGSAVPATAFVLDSLGFEQASQNTMDQAALDFGFTTQGDVAFKGSDSTELLQYIAPSGLGSMATKGGFAIAKGAAKTETSRLLAKQSLKSKIGEEAVELGVQNLAITAGDITTGKFDEQGNIKSKFDTENYWSTYGLNLMGDAMFSAVGTSAVTSAAIGMREYKYKKSVEGKNYAEYNIDEDGLSVINTPIVDGRTEGGSFIPKIKEDKAVTPAIGETPDTMVARGNFEGMVKTGPNQYAKVGPDGKVVYGQSDGSGKVEFPKEEVQTQGGFLTLDSYNGMMGSSYKTVGELPGELPFAVVDKEGNFRVNTKSQGDIRGRDQKGNKIINLKDSNVDREAYSMTYGRKHLIRGIDDQANKIYENFGKMSDAEAEKLFTDMQQYMEIKEDGSVGYKDSMLNDLQRRIGEKNTVATYLEDDPNYQLVKNANAKQYGQEARVSGDRNQNMNSQVLLAQEYNMEALANTDLGNLKAFVDAFEGYMSSKADMASQSFELGNTQGKAAAATKAFFNTDTVQGKLVATGLKPEFKKALDTSYALNLAKQKVTDGLIPKESMNLQTVNGAFDLLGIEARGGDIEKFKLELVRKMNETGATDTLGSGEKGMTLENGRVMRGEVPDEDLTQALKTFGETPEERSDNINKILTNGSTMEKRGAVLTGQPGLVKNKYSLDDPVSDALANIMTNTKYFISDQGDKMLDRYFALASASKGTGNVFTDSDIQIALLSGALEASEVGTYKSWQPTAKAAMREVVDGFRREMFELNKLRNTYDSDLGIHFDVEIDSNTRVRYLGPVNPQNSLAARVILTTQDRQTSLFDASGAVDSDALELAYRSTLANFGLKVEGIHNMVDIENAFKGLSNALLDKNGNIKSNLFQKGSGLLDTVKLSKVLESASAKYATDLDIEKIISMSSIEQVRAINESVKKKTSTPIDLFAEIDSKNSGVSLNLGMLGYADNRFGIGGMIDTSMSDLYTEFADSMGLKRAEAKPPVIGNNYGASDYAASKALADAMLNNFFKTGELNPHIKGVYDRVADTNKALNKSITRKGELIRILKGLRDEVDANPEMKPQDAVNASQLSQNAKFELNKLIEAEQNNPQFMGVDLFTVLSAQQGIDAGRVLTDAEIISLTDLFAKGMEKTVATGLRRLYHKKFPLLDKLRKDMFDFTNQMSQVFAYKYLRADMDRLKAIDVTKQIMKDLGNKVDDTIINDIINSAQKTGSYYSIKDIIEAARFKDYMSNEIYGTTVMKDIIPYMDVGNGKQVPMITMKGFAGYAGAVSFKAPTPIQVFQPIFTIAHDSLIMGQSLTDGVTNISDAFVGSKSLNSNTANANRNFASVIKNNNPYEMMLTTYNEQMNSVAPFVNDSMLQGKVDTWLAQQEILSKGNKISDTYVDAVKKKNSDNTIAGMNVDSDMTTLLSDGVNDVNMNKANNFSDDMIIANYSNGSSSNVVTMSEATDLTRNTDTIKEFQKTKNYEYKLESMKDIDTSKAQDVGRIYDSSTGKASADSNVAVSFGAASSRKFHTEDPTGNILHQVEITHDKPSVDALRELIHELTHVAADDNNHYLTDLQDTILDLAQNSRLTDADGNPVGFAVDPKQVANGEPLSQIMHQLYMNEVLMDNTFEMAKALGEKDLAQYVVPMKIDGGLIYKASDMTTYFRETNQADNASMFKKLANNVNGSLNSNVDIKAFLNGKERDKFNTVLKDQHNFVLATRELVNQTNQKIGTIGVSDLFTLDPSKDAVEYALSLKNGGDNHLQSMVAEFNKQMKEMIDYENNPSFDRNVGNLALVGAHKFLKELKDARTSDDFVKNVGTQLGKERRSVRKQFEGNMSIYNTLESNIKALAFGKDANMTAQSVADKALKNLYPASTDMVMANRTALKEFVVREAAYMRMQKYETSIGKAFSDLTDPALKDNAINMLNMLENRYTNNSTLFGANPSYDLSANNARGKAMKRSEFKGNKNSIIGSTVLNGEEWLVISKTDNNFIVGKQQSQLQNMDVSEVSTGVYKVPAGQDGYVTINPQNINPANKYIDNSISNMLSRNLYATQAKDIGRDIAFRQFETLKDSGVLLTSAEYSKLSTEDKSNYTQASSSNPMTQQFGRHHYSKKWVKYFEGSSGFNMGTKNTGKLFGKELGALVTGMAKAVIGATQALKGPILVYRASSYVNSVTSNMMIYTINSDDALSPKKRYKQAKTGLDSYKAALRESVDAELRGDSPELVAASKKAVTEHELHPAFQSGIASTIRSDAYTTGSYNENVLYTGLKSITGDSKMADQIKTLLADPSTKWGTQIGEVFDNTEVIPKLMMYLANKDVKGSKAAIQEVLLAFPTYNNLDPVLNAIDQISPYTKYLSNYPKMAMYSISQNPAKLLGMQALFFLGVRSSYGQEVSEDESFWYDHNFINIFGFGAKNWESLNPYWVPSKQMDGFGIVDYSFVPSAADSLTSPAKVVLPFSLQ